MAYFPFFVELAGTRGLIVGGGTVALRKAEKLLPYGPALTVVCPQPLPALAALPGVTLVRRAFVPGDLAPAPAFVIAATDDRALNARIAALCRRRHIPVNAVDDAAACSFLFPALVRRGPLSVGISTGGASPAAAAALRRRVEAAIPEQTGPILTWLAKLRPALKARFSAEPDRADRCRALWQEALRLGRPLTGPETEALLAGGARPAAGQVFLVGAGCGRADWITVRGLACIRRCDALVYDDLIDKALLEEAPAEAERIYMGKRAGRHSAGQREINERLIGLARQGRTVVRLKGGDPFLFGRGGEELAALQQAGIPCEVVPGIPSALGIPAQAGIPVTCRGLSRSVHIVAGHTADTPDGLPELAPLAVLEGTLVFLMGLRQLERIADGLMAAGKAPDTPVAVLAGGNAPEAFALCGRLDTIARQSQAACIQPPAVIVIGPAAAFPQGL